MTIAIETNGSVIPNTDINAIVSLLQVPAGRTEIRRYALEDSAYIANATCSMYLTFLNKFSVPVSVTVNTVDVASVNLVTSPPTIGHLTQHGAQIWSASTAAGGNSRCAGFATAQF